MKNLEGRVGDDLAIPEFAAIQSTLKDIESRLAALARVKLKPVAISEDALQSDVSTTPSPLPFAIGLLLAGGLFGYLWALIRTRKRTTTS
jgi:hypothetical protein